MKRRRATLFRSVLASVPVLLATAGCNLLLGLGDYKDACPGVERGEACPDAGLCTPGQKVECYTGPDGTEGNGICHGGMKTCGSDGLFGPCDGEVTPREKEICGNGLDDDCSGKVDDGCPCTPGNSYACYTGPMGTAGVGACKRGTSVCEQDGMTLGPCKGEVLPKAEDYGKKGDENCDGIPSADTAWVDVLTAPGGTVFATGVTSDEKGNVYVTGAFQGSLSVGMTALDSPDAVAGFVAKATPQGAWVWARSFDGAIFGAPSFASNGIAYDPSSGHLLGVGETTGTDFGAPNGPLPQGVFVVALDAASGSVAWSFGCEMSTALHASASSIALGPSGSVTIGGVYKGSLACGGTAMTSASSASYSAFVARVDSNGAPVWATSWGDSSTTTPVDQELFGLAVDSDGSTWLSGGLRGHAIVAGHALTAAGTTDSDVLLARLKPDGSFAAYAKNFGDAATQQGSALSLDQDGNVYLTGFKEGSLDFGNGALPQLGGDTIFVAAFDATGAPLWSEGFGGAAANNEYGNAIAVEPDGTLFVASTFVGGVNFGAGAFISGAANYTALARFAAGAPDQPGGVIWNRFYGGDKSNTHASATVAAAALAPRGQSMVRDVLLVGRFAEPADFGTGMVGPMQALPNASAFVMRVAP